MAIRSSVERQIAAYVIDRVINALPSCTVEVRDEEGQRLAPTRDKRAILDELGKAEIEGLSVHDKGERVGHFQFIWGEGVDCLQDFSGVPGCVCDRICDATWKKFAS